MMRYYYPDLNHHTINFICDTYQWRKHAGRGFGLLPEQYNNTYPWHEVVVDLIQPWVVKIRDKWYESNTLTSIDLLTNPIK